jgi:hypothetical protein
MLHCLVCPAHGGCACQGHVDVHIFPLPELRFRTTLWCLKCCFHVLAAVNDSNFLKAKRSVLLACANAYSTCRFLHGGMRVG